MAQQIINVGTTANDGTGDPLRVAGQKINSNFGEVYNTSQLAFNQANAGSVIAQAAFNYANTIVSDTQIDPFARVTANAAFNQANDANVLAQAAFDAANTANGATVTGNIVINSSNSEINFVSNSSGDGIGYSTIQLVPDTNTTSDQYIIIDPTAPSHIHIRAGGTQDSSGAQLFLGGEKNYVRVTDNQGVRIQNEELNDNYNYYSNTVQYVNGTWYEDSGNYFIQFTSDNSQMVTDLSNFASGSPNEVILYWDTGTEVVSNTMISITGFWQGIGNVYVAQVNSTLPANNTVLTAIEFHLFTTNTNYLGLENNDLTIDVADDIRMYARDIFSLRNWSSEEPITIITDYDANAWTWSFNVDGELRVPGAVNFQQNTTIPLGPPVINGTNDRVRLWDFEGTGSGFNYAIGAEGNHMWFSMDVNNGTGGFKFYSQNNQIFKIRDDGALLFTDSSIQTTAANQGFRNTLLINTATHNAANNEEVLLCDPNAAGANIVMNLSANVSDGKIFTIKNINPGGYSVNVGATTIEDPVTKSIVSEVIMANTGEVYTWVAYSGVYRHIG